MKAVIVLLILIIAVTSCQPADQLTGGREVTNANGLSYTLLIIEGMPCIYYERTGFETGYAGLTCNWDEWRP